MSHEHTRKQRTNRGHEQDVDDDHEHGHEHEKPKKPKKPKDVKEAVVEGLKKVCWGDSYNESMYKPGEEKRVRKELDQQAKEKPKKPGYDKKYADEFKKYAEKFKKKK